MSFLELGDRLAIAVAPAAGLIRVGNFFNSEILGVPTNLPWAVVFIRVDSIPRHPMLYESAAYSIVFFVLYFAYWKTGIARFPASDPGHGPDPFFHCPFHSSSTSRKKWRSHKGSSSTWGSYPQCRRELERPDFEKVLNRLSSNWDIPRWPVKPGGLWLNL